jgi:hypothetical protein
VASDPLGPGLLDALRRVSDLGADTGTVGVVVPSDRIDQVRGILAAEPDRAEVRVLDARRVKGLEFDDLIVAAPEAILRASPLGAHDLYVALTRATRSLHVVTAEPSLEVLAELQR